MKNSLKTSARQLAFWAGLTLIVLCVWLISSEQASDTSSLSTDDSAVAAANIDRFGFTIREILSPTMRVTPLRIFSAPLPSAR